MSAAPRKARRPASRNVLSCYDCGSTIKGHHTPRCELAEKGAKRDLPQVAGTQYWDKARPAGRCALENYDPREYSITVSLRTKKYPHGEFLFRTDYKPDRAQTIALARQLSEFYSGNGFVKIVSRSLTLVQVEF